MTIKLNEAFYALILCDLFKIFHQTYYDGEGSFAPLFSLLTHDCRVTNLNAQLLSIVSGPTTILHAAGAIALRATSQQVKGFIDNPLIRAIYANRELQNRRATPHH